MPVYEYECCDCSVQFELRRSFADDSEAYCPECRGAGHRLFSPVPIIFNGSGFYVTDSRDDGSKSGGTKNTSRSPETTKQT